MSKKIEHQSGLNGHALTTLVFRNLPKALLCLSGRAPQLAILLHAAIQHHVLQVVLHSHSNLHQLEAMNQQLSRVTVVGKKSLDSKILPIRVTRNG